MRYVCVKKSKHYNRKDILQFKLLRYFLSIQFPCFSFLYYLYWTWLLQHMIELCLDTCTIQILLFSSARISSSWNHRTLELLSLKKTCKIIKCNQQPRIIMFTTKACSQVSDPYLLWIPTEWKLHCLPGQPISIPVHPFHEEIFPDI